MKKAVILFAMLLLLSCVKKIKKPNNLIPEKKMENILVDIFLFKAIITSSYGEIKNKDAIGEQFIYKKYNIDSLQFRESETYYLKKTKTYLKIYQQVEKRLDKLKDSINESLKVNKDSLK